MDNDPDFRGPVELPGDNTRYKSPKFNPKRPFLETAKKPFLIVLALLVIAGAGYGIWKIILSKSDKPAPASQPNQSPSPAQITAASDIAEAKNSETFKSSDLRIEFQYPKAWKVSEADGGVRIVSPNFSYQAAGSGEKSGHFRIYIRKGAREVDGKYIGRGIAIKPSEKLTYSDPGLAQRKDTLISLFGVDSSENFALFLIAGNFQLNKGDTLGPNYGREPDTFIIGGGYTSADLTDDLATNPVPAEAIANSEAYKQAVEIVKSIKL